MIGERRHQHTNMQPSRTHRIASLALLVLIAFGGSTYAQTPDFRIDSSDLQHTFTVAGTGYIPVYNLTNHALNLHCTSVTNSSIVIEPADFDSTKYRPVYHVYVAYGFYNSASSLSTTIYDSTASQTITISGQDTSARNHWLPFDIQASSLLTFSHNRTTANGWFAIEAYGDSTQHAVLSLTQSGNAFALDSSVVTVPPSPSVDQPSWTPVRIRYTRTGNAFDTAYLTIRSWTNDGQHTYLVSAIATPEISDIDLKAPNVSFGVLTPSDTVCEDFVISNPSDTSVTIDSISVDPDIRQYYSDDFHMSDPTPVTLAGHSSLTIHACLTPHSGWDTTEYRRVHIHYTDSLGLSAEVYGDLVGRIAHCVSLTPDSLQFSDIIPGGSASKTVTVTNNLSDSTSIADSVLLFGSIQLTFPNGDPFPMKLGPHESRSIQIVLSDTSVGWQHAQLLLFPLDSAGNLLCQSTNELIVHVMELGDSTQLSIFGRDSEYVPIVSNRSTITRTFTFVNDATDSIRVLSATLAGSSGHFTITGISPNLPVTLEPHGTVQVSVEFDADTNGIYRDTLVIVTDNALLANRIPIVGSRLSGVADVSTTESSAVMLTVYPNPATSSVTLDARGMRVSSVEVLDLLGMIVHHATAPSIDLTSMPRGNYIVRVTGVTPSGQIVVRSSKLDVR